MNRKATIILNDQKADLNAKWTDVLRVGDWQESYKEFRVTLEDLEKIVENFNNNVLALDEGEIQFNYSHASYSEAAGWIKSLRIENNVLQAQVRWTKKARQRIADEEFKYVSAEIDFSYRDEESGDRYGVTLTGAALTNIPFVRGLKAVALSDKSEKNNVFIFSNPLFKMDKFKELLSTLEASENVTLSEVSVLKGAMAMLSEDEQAEVTESVTALEETAKANDEATEQEQTEATEQAEAQAQELADLKAKVELSSQSETEQVKNLAEAQKQLSEAQKELDTLKHEARKAEMEGAVKELCEAGKLLPKDREATLELLLDESPAKATKWLERLNAMPAFVDLSERGLDQDPEANAKVVDGVVDLSVYAEEAEKLMKLDSTLTRGQALQRVATEKGAYDFLNQKN